MADCSADDSVELESMIHDSSWHPCKVSQSLTGFGLAVDFGSPYLDNVILDNEEVLKKLRIRSVPLQGDDCSEINEGQIVLATCATKSNGLFFDAKVEKTLKVKHSTRIHCRCSFIIKWVHRDVEGPLTIPSTSILKLATDSVKDHPAVAEFLYTFHLRAASFHMGFEETAFETHLQLLLEKQIKDINNANNASTRKSPEILLEVEEEASQICSSLLQDSSEQKLYSTECTQDLYLENSSHLNPLAARAALASLRSKLLPRNMFGDGSINAASLKQTNDSPIHFLKGIFSKSDSWESRTLAEGRTNITETKFISKTAQEPQGKLSSIKKTNQQVKKSSSSKKQEFQCSHRPLTRSQRL